MFFRRSNEPVSTTRKTNTAVTRREPSVTTRPTSTTSIQTNNQINAQVVQNGPVSPIAVAQARRTQNTNPAASFSGKDQLRKLTVGRDISLNGEIGTCDHLLVEGNVKATIKGGKILEIAETGFYQGVVDIEQADIAGTFEGDLIVRGKLIIRPTAHVTGNLYYNRLQVDTGATINAQLNSLSHQQQENYQPTEVEQPQQNYAAPAQQQTSYTQAPIQQDPQRMFSLASLNDEPGFLRANAN